MRRRFIKRVAVAERPQLDAGERQTRHGDGVTTADGTKLYLGTFAKRTYSHTSNPPTSATIGSGLTSIMFWATFRSRSEWAAGHARG